MELMINGFSVIGNKNDLVEILGVKNSVVTPKLVSNKRKRAGSSIDSPIMYKIRKCLRDHPNEWLTSKQIRVLSGVKNVSQRMPELVELGAVDRRKLDKFLEYHCVEHDLHAVNGITYISSTKLGE